MPRGHGAYDRYNDYDRLVPPLPVPGYPVATTQTVVTTRRIIGSSLGYGGYGDPDTVVTTRRVVAPDPMLEGNDILTTPSPYRRVVRGATVVAPAAWQHEQHLARRSRQASTHLSWSRA